MTEGIQNESEEIINDGDLGEITPEPIEAPAEPQESEPQEPAPEAYEPDFSYKYKDEEFKFDERLQGLVKDKDSEQYVRDLVTAEKAIGEYKEVGGIREIQDKLGNYERYEEGFNSHTELNQEIDQLSAMLATNSTAGVESFRQHLGIDKELLLKWASEEATAMKNPEQAQQIYDQRQMGIENFNLQYQNNQMHNVQETQIVQQRTAELDGLLGSNSVAQNYDNLVGTPGSFKQEVINHGATVYHQSNGQTVLSVADAVLAVQGKYQGLVANQNSGTNTQVAQNPEEQKQVKSDPQQTVVIRNESKQTIPSLSGSSGSPAKKKITSLSQMRAAAKAMD